MWLVALRRYLLVIPVANLAWETAQLPLYTVWREGSPREVAFAVAHCTAGDLLIATMSLVLALLVLGVPDWPARGFGRVATAALVLGVGYTAFSEWLNTTVRGGWTYTELMPVVPVLGTGLAPLAQWVLIPLAAFAWTYRGVTSRRSGAYA